MGRHPPTPLPLLCHRHKSNGWMEPQALESVSTSPTDDTVTRFQRQQKLRSTLATAINTENPIEVPQRNSPMRVHKDFPWIDMLWLSFLGMSSVHY